MLRPVLPQVIRLLADLSFAGSSYARRGRTGEYRLCGDEATLDEAPKRIGTTPFAVCVLEEIEDASPGREAATAV